MRNERAIWSATLIVALATIAATAVFYFTETAWIVAFLAWVSMWIHLHKWLVSRNNATEDTSILQLGKLLSMLLKPPGRH